MVAARLIDLTANEGGSPYGWSYYSQWLDGCNMRPWLASQAQPYGGTGFDKDAFVLGRIVHKLLDLHESHNRYQDYVLQSGVIKPWIVSQAQKVFANYRTHYPPGHWGRIYDREKLLQAKLDLPGGAHLDNTTFLPYTGRQDGKVKIDKKSKLHWLALGVPVTLGHTYRIDYKTFTPEWDPQQYLHSPQFTGYDYIDREDTSGTLIIGINKVDLKRPPAMGLLIPRPTKEKIEIWKHAVRLAAMYMRPPYIPNPGRCGRGSYRCSYFMRECNLHTIKKGN